MDVHTVDLIWVNGDTQIFEEDVTRSRLHTQIQRLGVELEVCLQWEAIDEMFNGDEGVVGLHLFRHWYHRVQILISQKLQLWKEMMGSEQLTSSIMERDKGTLWAVLYPSTQLSCQIIYYERLEPLYLYCGKMPMPMPS